MYLLSYLWELLPYCLGGVCACVITGAIIFVKDKNMRIRRSCCFWIVYTMLGCYLSFLFSQTVSPTFGGYTLRLSLQDINLIPFRVLSTVTSAPVNFFGNMLLFIPMGMALPLLSARYRKWYKTAKVGLTISFIIEFLQLFLIRGTDVDDLLLNTVGTLAGYGIYSLAGILFPNLLSLFQAKRLRGTENAAILARQKKAEMLSCTGLILFSLIFVMLSGMGLRHHFLQTDTKEGDVLPILLDESAARQELDVQVDASHACLIDGESGALLFEKGGEEPIAPASTTKILTALTVRSVCDMEEEVTVGLEIHQVYTDASVAWLQEGNRLDVETLLYALLLPSGNDAAYTLAVHGGRCLAGDMNLEMDAAIEKFVDAMNQLAQDLGAENCNIVRPDGYDAPGQTVTARDMAILAMAFMRDEELARIAASPSKRCIFADGTDVTYQNTNEMLHTDSSYYDPDMIGLKTGYSGEAGNCLVGAARKNGHLYISVVMGSTQEGRWMDTKKLIDAAK